jgi:hypothetical protein
MRQAWKSIYVKDCEVGFKLLSENGVHNTGSILVVDSVFEGVGKAILTFPAEGKKGDGTTGLTLDNIKFINTKEGVVDNAGNSYLATDSDVDTFVLGSIYVNQQKATALHTRYATKRDPALVGENPWNLPKAPFFERAKPQYTDTAESRVLHVRDSCKGAPSTGEVCCLADVNGSTAQDTERRTTRNAYSGSSTTTQRTRSSIPTQART